VQQVRKTGTRFHHVFEVVQNEEHALVCEVMGNASQRRLVAHVAQIESPDNGRADQAVIDDTGEGNKDDAICERVSGGICCGQSQSRLANSTRASERDEVGMLCLHHRCNVRDLSGPANEWSVGSFDPASRQEDRLGGSL
jgi:hypothetical protein